MLPIFTRKNAVSHVLAGASLTSLLAAGAVEARTLPLRILRAQQAAAYARMPFPSRHSLRVVTFAPLGADAGGTAPSATYYKLTNVTAQVHGTNGIAYAVNNDGRIAYTDYGYLAATNPVESAYIVNNGGTFGRLVHPTFYGGRPTALAAFALNENAEIVGGLQTPDPDGGWFDNGNIAWTLSGSTGSTVAYFGSSDQQSAYAVNDYNVSVGGDESAELFEPSSSPSGKTIELPGLKGELCSSVASAINDAGEIVGTACNRAVRFSTTSFAELLPVTTQNVSSSAEAINRAGDVVGSAGKYAFLYRGGKTTYLPVPSADRGKVASAVAFAVNSTDEIVGMSYDEYGDAYSPFFYRNGRSYDLNALIEPNSGWQINDAYGINDRGEIVGDAEYRNNYYGVSLKPPQ